MKNNTKIRLHLSKQLFESLTKQVLAESRDNMSGGAYTEAVKAPKQTVTEYTPQPSPSYSSSPSLTMEQKREQYRNILGETATGFTTQNVGEFRPQGVMPGSDLPAGELSMNQIMGLMNK